MSCTHPITQGDNYGETCSVCGEVIKGMGYWGKGGNSTTCVHVFWVPENNPRIKICYYCEAEVLNENFEEKEGQDYLLLDGKKAYPGDRVHYKMIGLRGEIMPRYGTLWHQDDDDWWVQWDEEWETGFEEYVKSIKIPLEKT